MSEEKFLINYTEVKRRLSRYASYELKLDEDCDKQVTLCINKLHVWASEGHVNNRSELEQCVKSLMQDLRQVALRKHTITDQQSKNQTLCWTCKNAVPMLFGSDYVQGCEWSIDLKPVPGWKAKKTVCDDRISYRVKTCPKFIRG